MLGFQTLACLHDIPVVRSSTDKLQNVYAKAKDTSVLIRLPCYLAETVADASLKIALTVANPLVKPFYGSVRVIDDYAAQKIRQIESKYPAINTPTDEMVNSFNEKTEPVRNVMNSVKDTTTSTIQQGKDTVSNVATATVNKASNVADSVFSFCETHVPGIQRRQTGKQTGANGYVFSTIGSLLDYAFHSVQSSLIWVRMLAVFFLLKTKQTNDVVLNKLQQIPFLTVLPQRLLILTGALLEYFIGHIRPDDRTLAELKKTKQQSRLSQQQQQQSRVNHQQQQHSRVSHQQDQQSRVSHQQEQHSRVSHQQEQHSRVSHQQEQPSPQYFTNRQSFKSDPSVTTRQSVVTTQQETHITRSSGANVVSKPPPQPDYSNMTDTEELYARLAAGNTYQSTYVDNDAYTREPVDLASSGDIAQLHAQLHPTDVELLYSRLPTDIVPDTENSEPLTEDQQQLHARIIGAELERQGYTE